MEWTPKGDLENGDSSLKPASRGTRDQARRSTASKNSATDEWSETGCARFPQSMVKTHAQEIRGSALACLDQPYLDTETDQIRSNNEKHQVLVADYHAEVLTESADHRSD